MSKYPPRNLSYLVTPRYLAGPDKAATANVIEEMLANRWHATRTRGALVLRLDHQDELLEVLHIPQRATAPDGKCPAIGWELTARPGPGQERTWAARFTRDTPPELIAALLAEATRPRTTPASADRRRNQPALLPVAEATRPLEAAKWIRDLAMHECAWYAPGERAVVVTPLQPEAPDREGAHWLFAARRATENVALWHGTAHPHTPTHLVRALCEAMTDPTPVPRQTHPPFDDEDLTVTPQK
ncbi:DUF317 domain-containing protein [Streptomyces sp. TS71-3]|uniref:DUF317 domain-containing protein n=1 Tax=Streptomyces sp. TS71-3 TaxID=2733862 RepID=UPI001B1CB1A8|nr:DUF317 domain-containing protein [Streptomyces sp. TS71-3]GHJ35454.1 hypothetical protein Sm713_10630 [Streptomyces sp. TS71-3]